MPFLKWFWNHCFLPKRHSTGTFISLKKRTSERSSNPLICLSSPKVRLSGFSSSLLFYYETSDIFIIINFEAKNVNVSAKPALEIHILTVNDIMFTIFRQFSSLFGLHQTSIRLHIKQYAPNLVPAAKSGKYFCFELRFRIMGWSVPIPVCAP